MSLHGNTDILRHRWRAFVFDLDGTLVDTMASVPAGYRAAVRRLGGPLISDQQVVRAWQRGSSEAVLADLLRRPVGQPDLAVLSQELQTAAATAAAFPHVSTLLQALRRQGYKLGVYTGASRELATAVLQTVQLAGHFSIIVCGDDVSRPKPDPEGLLQACARLQVAPADSIYVGDSVADRACAEAAGAAFSPADAAAGLPFADLDQTVQHDNTAAGPGCGA